MKYNIYVSVVHINNYFIKYYRKIKYNFKKEYLFNLINYIIFIYILFFYYNMLYYFFNYHNLITNFLLKK